MGGSLRRSKKFRTKLTIKRKRAPLTKGKVPLDITQGRRAVEQKLGKQPVWSQQKNFADNYAAAGLMSDPNSGFGRNTKADGLKEATALAEGREASGQPAAEIDEDFEAACGKKRPGGANPPPRLTSHQRAIVRRLIDAHGDDVEAMRRDSKLNSMLLPSAKLKRMLESYTLHGNIRGVDFRVPTKRLW